MSAVRIYVDEDACEHAVVVGLRSRGVDLLTTLEANRTRANDAAQLEFAVQEQRSIYTFNLRDFAKLHSEYLQQGKDHHGIIVLPGQRYSIGEKIRAVAYLVASLTAEEMTNRIEYL